MPHIFSGEKNKRQQVLKFSVRPEKNHVSPANSNRSQSTGHRQCRDRARREQPSRRALKAALLNGLASVALSPRSLCGRSERHSRSTRGISEASRGVRFATAGGTCEPSGTVVPESEPRCASKWLPAAHLPPWPLQGASALHKDRLRLPGVGVCRSSRGDGRDVGA